MRVDLLGISRFDCNFGSLSREVRRLVGSDCNLDCYHKLVRTDCNLDRNHKLVGYNFDVSLECNYHIIEFFG